VLKETGPSGEERLWTYDLRGRRTDEDRLLDGSVGERVQRQWDYSLGNFLQKVTEDVGGIGAATTFTRDFAARRMDRVDALGHGWRTVYGYGSHGLPWQRYNLDSGTAELVQTVERDFMGRVTAVVGQGGRRTRYDYDGYGRRTLVETELPGGGKRQTIRTLEDWGAPAKVEVRVGSTILASTLYDYDEALRRWQEVEQDPTGTLGNRVTTWRRDADGRVVEETDPRGYVWKTVWDAAGRVEKTVEPAVAGGSNEVVYSRDDATRTTTVTERAWNTDTQVWTEYVRKEIRDASGRLQEVQDLGSGSTARSTTWTWDEGGRQRSRTSPLGHVTRWTYDKLDRLRTETRPIDSGAVPAEEATTTWSWQVDGLVQSITDENLVPTDYAWDSYHRLDTVTLHDGARSHVYDRGYQNGMLTSILDPLGVELAFGYDDAGRLESVEAKGNVTGLEGPRRLFYGWDDLDRLVTAKTQDPDGGGGWTDRTVVTRTWNGFGELATETQHGGQVVGYSRDPDGGVRTVTWPAGGPVQEVEYLRDAAGRLAEVRHALGSQVEGSPSPLTAALLSWEGHREIRRQQAWMGVERTQSWTDWREPEELRYTATGPGTLLTGLQSWWDAGGRLVARARLHDTDTGGHPWGEVFRYDEMDRLVAMWWNIQDPGAWQVTEPTEATATFDERRAHDLGPVYERLAVKVTPYGGQESTTAYTTNGFYQYTAVGGTTRSWDANGQLTGDGTWTYTWTAFGQLAEATPVSGPARSYEYDALGRRVETREGSSVRRYLYLGWQMVGEHDGSQWLWQEVPLPGDGMLEHVALDDADVDGDQDTSEYRVYAAHEDFQHTVWGLSDATGALAERYRYGNPYGDNVAEQADGTPLGPFGSRVHQQKRWHGAVVDPVTELADHRLRWLDPETGSWLSRDPLGVHDSTNLYQAMLAAPTVGTDPWGLTTGGWATAGSPGWEAPGGLWTSSGGTGHGPRTLMVMDEKECLDLFWANVYSCQDDYRNDMSEQGSVAGAAAWGAGTGAITGGGGAAAGGAPPPRRHRCGSCDGLTDRGR